MRYGVYDVAANDGFVNVGVTADTAEFAVQSIIGANAWDCTAIPKCRS